MSVDNLSPEIMDPNIDFNRLEDPVMNSSEDEAPTLYINSVKQPKQKTPTVMEGNMVCNIDTFIKLSKL